MSFHYCARLESISAAQRDGYAASGSNRNILHPYLRWLTGDLGHQTYYRIQESSCSGKNYVRYVSNFILKQISFFCGEHGK